MERFKPVPVSVSAQKAHNTIHNLLQGRNIFGRERKPLCSHYTFKGLYYLLTCCSCCHRYPALCIFINPHVPSMKKMIAQSEINAMQNLLVIQTCWQYIREKSYHFICRYFAIFSSQCRGKWTKMIFILYCHILHTTAPWWFSQDYKNSLQGIQTVLLSRYSGPSVERAYVTPENIY